MSTNTNVDFERCWMRNVDAKIADKYKYRMRNVDTNITDKYKCRVRLVSISLGCINSCPFLITVIRVHIILTSTIDAPFYFVHLVWLTSCVSIMSATPVISFSTSNKGKSILICEGFIYQLNRTRKKAKYWRCKDRMCSAYIHTDQNNQYIGKSGDHGSHLPIPESIEVTVFKAKVKERIARETVAIRKIYDNELASAALSEAALALISLPSEASKHSYLSISPMFVLFIL